MGSNKNFVDEARRILELIDEKLTKNEKEYMFIESIKSRVRLNDFVSEKQIFWLRDIKDRQLDRQAHFKEYDDKEDSYRD